MNKINNLTTKDYDKFAYYLMLLFAFGAVVSRSLREITFYLMVLLVLFSIYKSKQIFFNKDRLLFSGFLFFYFSIILNIFLIAKFEYVDYRYLKAITSFIMIVVMIYTFDFNKQKLLNIFFVLNLGFLINLFYSIYQGLFLNIKRTTGFLDVMHLAAILNFVNIYLLLYLLYSKLSVKIKLLLFILYIFDTIAIILNASRGAWLSLFVTITICLFIKNYKHAIIFIFLAIMIIFAVIKGPNNYFKNRLISITNTKTNTSNSIRLYMWQSGIKIFKAHPITGIGNNKFIEYYKKPEFKVGNFNTNVVSTTHNNIIELMTENGLIGLISFLAMMSIVFIRLFQNFKRTVNKNDQIFLFGGIGVFLLYNLQGMTENNITSTKLMWIFWLIMAINLYYGRIVNLKSNE